MNAIGVDIGGTKVAVAIIGSDQTISGRKEEPTKTHHREELFNQIVEMIKSVMTDQNLSWSDVSGIGIGVPGAVDHVNGIAVFQNNIPWNKFPVVERLKATFPDAKEIKIDNDVKVAALAEYNAFSIEQDEVFTYLTLSTGIAITSFINDRIIRGHGFSGEIGFLPYQGLDGNIHTFETLASGPGIERLARNMMNLPEITAREVFDKFKNGNPVAKDLITFTADVTARAIYAIVTIADPSILVMGGSVATNNPAYVDLIKEKLSNYMVEQQRHLLQNIHISKLGSDNGIIGAGMLVL